MWVLIVKLFLILLLERWPHTASLVYVWIEMVRLAVWISHISALVSVSFVLRLILLTLCNTHRPVDKLFSLQLFECLHIVDTLDQWLKHFCQIRSPSRINFMVSTCSLPLVFWTTCLGALILYIDVVVIDITSIVTTTIMGFV